IISNFTLGSANKLGVRHESSVGNECILWDQTQNCWDTCAGFESGTPVLDPYHPMMLKAIPIRTAKLIRSEDFIR
ncbi:MAG: hypothetical protein ACO3DP_05195, partial [Candidatus Nanopelagicaceae bacterium]